MEHLSKSFALRKQNTLVVFFLLGILFLCIQIFLKHVLKNICSVLEHLAAFHLLVREFLQNYYPGSKKKKERKTQHAIFDKFLTKVWYIFKIIIKYVWNIILKVTLFWFSRGVKYFLWPKHIKQNVNGIYNKTL